MKSWTRRNLIRCARRPASTAWSKYRKNAVFGKAVALGRSKDNAKVETAIKMMKDELSKEESSANPDRKAMEDAQYNLVKFTSARQDWPSVIAAADKYRENKSYKKNLPEVLYLQGEAYLKQNELDKALINFMNITGTYKGLVKWSAPAVLAQMDTLWKRNTMSQGAGQAARPTGISPGRPAASMCNCWILPPTARR